MTGQGFLSPGHDFGSRYHIIRLLGAGGMGAVYQAWDRTLEVAVAIKIVRPQAGADPDATVAAERRFKRELLLARQVTHKNVVRIHDLGEIDGITYITMPYVQGSDLASIIRREGRMPVDRALAIAKQIGAGLVAAHDAGVIHRDLKPANIMIDADDSALIMDFGIARSAAGGMTMTVGAGVGTIEYMAPEQARGEAVDQRADIYAFGLIVNDMLLGRRQSGEATAVAELMARIRHAPAVGPVDRSDDPGMARRARDALSRAESRRAVRADEGGARRARGRRARRPHDRDSGPRPDGRDVDDGGRRGCASHAVRNGALAHRRCGGDRAGGRGVDASRPLVRRLTGAGGRRGADLARGAAVPQRVRGSDARFARLEPEPGARHRARAVLARAHGAVRSDASGPSGSEDRAQLDAGPAGARAGRRLHEREARALGPVLALRRRDSHRRDAAGSRRRAERAAQRHGRQRERAS